MGDILGVGVDAVDIDRFREVLARRPGLVERMFTDTEREYARRVPDPTQRLAARFAAKEAVLKTLGVGIGAAGLREIEVRRNSEGAPFLALAGAAATLAAKRGITRWHLSLTHTDLVAVASAVAEGGAP